MSTFSNLNAWIVLLVNVLCVQLVFSECPINWLTVNTSSTPAQTCYRLFPDQVQGFDAAAAFCQSQGGYLARDTSAVVHNNLKPDVWAAVVALKHSIYWFGLTDNNSTSGQWYWHGGTTVGSFTDLSSGNRGTANARDCGYIAASMSDFYWLSTTSCNTVMAVFCQRDFGAPPISTTTVQPINCLNGWYGFPTLHWCIKLFDSPLSWAASRGQCQAAGADLVRINNTNMYTFISLLINENRGVYWIGLNDQKTEGTFSWLDDTAKANYTEWAPGMPNNAGGNENCVVADGNNNDKWDDLDCSTPNRFICQRVPFPGTPSPAPVVKMKDRAREKTGQTCESKSHGMDYQKKEEEEKRKKKQEEQKRKKEEEENRKKKEEEMEKQEEEEENKRKKKKRKEEKKRKKKLEEERKKK